MVYPKKLASCRRRTIRNRHAPSQEHLNRCPAPPPSEPSYPSEPASDTPQTESRLTTTRARYAGPVFETHTPIESSIVCPIPSFTVVLFGNPLAVTIHTNRPDQPAHAVTAVAGTSGTTVGVAKQMVDGLHQLGDYSQDLIERLLNEDSLTGLFNRSAFRTRLTSHFERGDDHEFALLTLDLDRFKPVNDTLGHGFGDLVLKYVADRILESANIQDSGDGDTVARLGGDEFAIIQSARSQPAAAHKLAKKIIAAVSEPIIIDGQSINLGVSIGVAMAPYDADCPNDLIRQSDLALYRAKADGRNTCRFFEPEMDAAMQRRRHLEIQMREAIQERQFELHYQPIVDLESGEIISFEALVRWVHPTMGRVFPDQFIPLAEETGLINPLGEWVIEQACRDAAQWDETIGVCVNLSAVQLDNRDLPSKVNQALQSAGLSPHRLELEVTETALLAETDLAVAMLHQFREMGVRISMDDFGTGYSSISYLRKFPFDKIKIDRSFVSGSDADVESAALVKMIAALGVSLGVKTTAEGVETQMEMESVRLAGCSEVQGYLFSKPVPFAEIPTLITRVRSTKTSAPTMVTDTRPNESGETDAANQPCETPSE